MSELKLLPFSILHSKFTILRRPLRIYNKIIYNIVRRVVAIYFGIMIVMVLVCIIFFVSWGAMIGVWGMMVRLKYCIGLVVIRLMGGDQYIQGT